MSNWKYSLPAKSAQKLPQILSPLRFSYPYIIAEKRAERESASLTGVASSNPIDPKVYAFVRDGSTSSLLAIKIKEAS